MLQVIVASYKVRELAKTNPEQYEWMRQFQTDYVPASEAPEKYQDEFKQYVNEVELIPDWMLEICQLKAVKPMLVLKDTGGLNAKAFRDAISCFQIHLPGNELLRIDDVKVLEDICTEVLQEELEKGWRIVAICPQAGQRRPDYVLGRRKCDGPNEES